MQHDAQTQTTTLRPRLHFTAERGWINDPIGITWRDGRYHLFFQYVPDADGWAPQCRWGHAISTDLLHWTELPVAIEPGDGDDGIWSGSVAIGADGDATALYTAVSVADVDAGRVRVAHPTDDEWLGWFKGATVALPPAEPPLAFFRDPFVLADGNGWRMLVGAALADGSGAVLGYTSPDLADWTYDGVAAQAAGADGAGSGWECPQLLDVGGTAVLVVSVLDASGLQHVAAATGEWAGGRFTARRWSRLTAGGHYAATAFRDAAGRPCLMHWIRGVQAADHSWTGAHSVPHLVAVDGDRVVLHPHPVLAAAEPSVVTLTGDTVIDEPGWEPVAVRIEHDDLVVGAESARLPAGDGGYRVLADGPVVEVWGAAGAIAVPRRPR